MNEDELPFDDDGFYSENGFDEFNQESEEFEEDLSEDDWLKWAEEE